jgi:hypothetical protein
MTDIHIYYATITAEVLVSDLGVGEMRLNDVCLRVGELRGDDDSRAKVNFTY